MSLSQAIEENDSRPNISIFNHKWHSKDEVNIYLFAIVSFKMKEFKFSGIFRGTQANGLTHFTVSMAIYFTFNSLILQHSHCGVIHPFRATIKNIWSGKFWIQYDVSISRCKFIFLIYSVSHIPPF